MKIFNGSGNGKKRRDLAASVSSAMLNEYIDRKTLPNYSFKFEDFSLRGGKVPVTEITRNGAGEEVMVARGKAKVKRHKSYFIHGDLKIRDHLALSLNTLKDKYAEDPNYYAVDISLYLRDHKRLAYRIGIELESRQLEGRHYVPRFIIDHQKFCDANMSFSDFKRIFDKI